MDVWEVVILLMICLSRVCVANKTRFKFNCFEHDNMNKRIEKIKKAYHLKVNVSLMIETNSNQNWNNNKCWCECKNPKEG